MTANPKYHRSSLYYPDDKDLKDFLEASRPPMPKLRSFLQRRGIYLSKNAQPENYFSYISVMPLSWTDLEELVDLVDLAEKKEKSSFEDYTFDGDFGLITEAFYKVREERSSKKKEQYSIRQEGGVVYVKVDYVEMDTSKTPMLQGRPAALTIELTKQSNTIRATHTNNEIAEKILIGFQGFLEQSYFGPNGEKRYVNSLVISLKDIIDPSLRVLFFKKLSRNLEGFEYSTTTNVKVARMPKHLRAGDSILNDEEEELDDEEEQKIKNVIFQGVHLESTQQYKDLLNEGFFISSISWESIETSTKDKVAFSAGFAKPDEATGFEYKIQHRQVLDNAKYLPKEKVLPMYLSKYKQCIQNSATISLTEVREEVAKRATKPAENPNTP